MAGTHEVLAAKARARASNCRSLDGRRPFTSTGWPSADTFTSRVLGDGMPLISGGSTTLAASMGRGRVS